MNFIESLHYSDFFSTFFLCCLLLIVGIKIAGEHPLSITYGKRAGYVTFLAYCIVALLHFSPSDAGEIAAIVIRALIFTGIVVGATWILMPIIQGLGAAGEKKRAARHRRELDQERRRHEEERQRLDKERRRGDDERKSLQLEIQRDSDTRAQRQRMVAELEKRQRLAARAQCELLYNLYKPLIASRFDKAALDEFMKKYMGDDQTPETVEKHGQQLCELIENHRREVEAPDDPTTIASVTEWMTAEQTRIEALPLDQRMKDELLRHLKIRYMKLAQDALKKATP
ncbi:MAG TPA: hypothetical protein VMV69_10415 [Pirellulales bacterium]|nr:hypothetical protein [Pirellulales bacterium]